MNFLSAAFLVFFPTVLFAYYILPKKTQNAVLLCANCAFYLWAGPIPGAWLLGAVLLSFLCARAMERFHHRRLWLAAGVLALFGTLFVFKYLDFAVRSLFTLAGRTAPPPLALSLPLGISFYSFTLAGYLFDVYRGKYPARRDLLRFAAFAGFFPSILSGPINRAPELLPQLERERRFEPDGFKAGLWRFLCGAAKKLVLSVPLGSAINYVYAAPEDYSGTALAMTACAYSVYIYVDFSAYSDMAVGAARMLGLELTENFRAPFLSRSVKELWKKWHISLTSWFRDYLYFPLGGSRKGKVRTWGNILIVFAVSGLWHGAGFAFLTWGLLNGLFQIIGEWTGPGRRRLRRVLRIPEDGWYTAAVQGLVTFLLFSVACVFFGTGSVTKSLLILQRILLIAWEGLQPVELPFPPLQGAVLLLGLGLVALEDVFLVRGRSFPIERTTFRFWTAVALLACVMLVFGQYGPGFQSQDFVYFHF